MYRLVDLTRFPYKCSTDIATKIRGDVSAKETYIAYSIYRLSYKYAIKQASKIHEALNMISTGNIGHKKQLRWWSISQKKDAIKQKYARISYH